MLKNNINGLLTVPVRWLRTTRRTPCPVCGKSGYCEISEDQQSAHCMSVPSGVPMHYRLGGWLHELIPRAVVTIADFRSSLAGKQSPDQREKDERVAPTPEIKPLEAEQIDRLNRALLALCPLSEVHRLYLAHHRIIPQGCGSLDYSQAVSIAHKLLEEFGPDTANRHPALMKVERTNGRNYWTIAGAATGILFPARNINDQILGVQIRKDQPRGSNDRYRWLSHAGLGGTPLTVFQAAPGSGTGVGTENFHMVIITEGYKKAAVAAQTWACHAISLAGVSAYKEADLIQTIEGLGVNVIVLAFDQDKRHNPQVKAAEQRLLRLLAAAMPHNDSYFLNWPEAAGKGLDDAIEAKTVFQFDPALTTGSIEGPRLANDLPGLVIDHNFNEASPVFTLDEARAQHRTFFDRLLAHPDKSQRVVTSPTGTGKSQAADDALSHALLSNRLSGRWLLLAPNKANIAERTGPGTMLGQAVFSGLAAIQQGRSLFDIEMLQTGSHRPQAEDCANPQAADAGAARQVTARVVCSQCPFGSDQNWKERAAEVGFNADQKPTRPWKCETQGYLYSRKVSRQAQLVIATKEAYLNNSDLLAEFDGGVIVDEELLGHLIEIVNIDTAVMAGWREKIALKSLRYPSWEQLFRIVETAFDNLATYTSADKTLNSTGIPGFGQELSTQTTDSNTPAPPSAGAGLAQLIESRPYLETAATSLGWDFEEVLAECAGPVITDQGPDQDGTYGFERHYRHNAKLVLPFRAATELLAALSDKQNPARFTRRPDGSFALVAHVPRRHLIELLQEKTLVILDATMPPALKILLPELTELHYRVRQNLHVTQTTNALYSKRDLYKPATRQLIEAAIATFSSGSNQPLSIVPMRFQEGHQALKLPTGSLVEHWGMHRATSRYSDCDSLVLVGHHLRPIDFIRAELIAARSFAGSHEDQTSHQNLGQVGTSSHEDSVVFRDLIGDKRASQNQPLKLRIYNHRLDNGRAAGRWMKTDTDSDIQAAIEHEYTANIIQAIGRLRAALRPDHLLPARVLILCNEPVADLKIDLLTTVEELTTNPPEKQQFINNSYVKVEESGGLVPAYDAVMTGRDLWDEDLIQDETRDTQLIFDGEWLDQWPDQPQPPAYPILE